MRLGGKVAIVTGGGRGLGRAIALSMAREGARVAVMARSRGAIEEVVRQIEDQGSKGLAIAGDVSQESDVLRMVRETLSRYSTVDILVNNAAIIGPARFLADADLNAWLKTININLNGVYLCTRAVVPIMVEKGQGKIINISSGLGQKPYPRLCAYAVSKAGLIQLTRSLAEELKEYNIQVNAIDPGLMDTAMQEEIRKFGPSSLGEEIHRRFMEFKEQGALKDPQEVAVLATFLSASPEADHLSGHFGTLSDYMRLGWRPQ